MNKEEVIIRNGDKERQLVTIGVMADQAEEQGQLIVQSFFLRP